MSELKNNKTETKLYYSRIGIITFILAVISVALIWGVFFIIYNFDPTQLGEESKEFVMVIVLMCFSSMVSMSGIVTGIIAVLQKQQKKLLPAFGLFVNIVALLTVLLVVFA